MKNNLKHKNKTNIKLVHFRSLGENKNINKP